MNDMPDFDDSDLPDFDSMSQEELIAWLEQLTKSQSRAGEEFLDDYPAEDADGEPLPDSGDGDFDWASWLDETSPLTGGSDADGATLRDDDDTPVDLSLFEDEDTAPTAAMDWLDEIAAQESPEALTDIRDYQPPAPAPDKLDDLIDKGDDPLDWLENLESVTWAKTGQPAASHPSGQDPAPNEAGADFDETYEDDETLDDLEDESLYANSLDEPLRFLDSLLGLVDGESEGHSTKSMAPAPEMPEPPAAPPQPLERGDNAQYQAGAGDKLAQAFLLQDKRGELEAWYAKRLQAIAQPSESAPPPENPAAKPPPPGLAAAINSARGKVEADELGDALRDYETLLQTSAGLEWVVTDMRALIEREKYRDIASLHRILGDALMRQGHLDAALDVYRRALSLL